MLSKKLDNIDLILRPLKNGDDEFLYNSRNDMDYIKNTKSLRLPKTQGLEKEWLVTNMSDKSNKNVVFIINFDGEDIGMVQLNSIDWISKNCNFGIAIFDRSFQGKGLAAEAMDLLFHYAFNTLGLHKISLEVVSFNEKAIKSYENFGFEKEGTLKEHYFWENKFHDVHIYALIKRTYLKQ